MPINEVKSTIRILNWRQMVVEAWGDEWEKPETAYKFSGDRKFDDSEEHGGAYDQD